MSGCIALTMLPIDCLYLNFNIHDSSAGKLLAGNSLKSNVPRSVPLTMSVREWMPG